MKSPLQRLMRLLLLRLAVRQKRLTMQWVHIKAALYCVRGVKAARGAFLGYLGLKCILGLFVCGVALLHIGFFLYVPWSLESRALVMMALGGVYVLVVIGIVAYLSRESWWMKQTGVSEIVEEAMRSDWQRKNRL